MDKDRLFDYFAELQRYESRGTLARPRCMLACRPKTAEHPSNRMRAFWPFSWSTIMRFSITCPWLPNLPIHPAPVKECPDRAVHPCDHSSSHRSMTDQVLNFLKLPPEFGDASRDFKTGTGAGAPPVSGRLSRPETSLARWHSVVDRSRALSFILPGESPCASLDSAIRL